MFSCTYRCVWHCSARVGGVFGRTVFLFVSDCFCFVSKYSNRCADHQMLIQVDHKEIRNGNSLPSGLEGISVLNYRFG